LIERANGWQGFRKIFLLPLHSVKMHISKNDITVSDSPAQVRFLVLELGAKAKDVNRVFSIWS
jgi:hypothetical protein